MNGTERAILWSTALAVPGVAVVAAVVSYQHGYEVVHAHGETGATARLVPLTVDGLIYASSMVLLHSARRGLPVPGLARWLLGVGITATLAANVAHGWAHGPVGATVQPAPDQDPDAIGRRSRRTGRVPNPAPRSRNANSPNSSGNHVDGARKIIIRVRRHESYAGPERNDEVQIETP